VLGEVEIVGRVERRRKWTPQEKAALLAEVESEGGRVSVVARRHRMSESLLYNWRSAWRAAISMRGPEPMEFLPIGVIGHAAEESPALLPAPERFPPSVERAGLIEIDLPGGARVRVDACVNEKALARVLRAMRGAV
jgi:transposase